MGEGLSNPPQARIAIMIVILAAFCVGFSVGWLLFLSA